MFLQNISNNSSLWCYDTEDVEDVLVDLGIGYFDRSGEYREGQPPAVEIPDIPDGTEPDTHAAGPRRRV